MDKIQGTTDPPPAVCPICGSAPTAELLRSMSGVNVGDYRDAAGHIWSTKWMVPA